MAFSPHKLWYALALTVILALMTGCAAPAAPAQNTPEATSTPAPPTDAPPPASTFTPVATNTQAPTPTPAPTNTPQPTATATPDCESFFQELVQEFGADYSECELNLTPPEDLCPKPKFLKAHGYQLNIELILDASGSMAGAAGGQSKLAAAQDVLTDFVGNLPASANVALRVYGHKGSNSEADKAASCQGSELLMPFQPLDQAAFTSAIRSFKPTGWTPIALSLQRASDDFASLTSDNATNMIILVSDGIETCGGDPVAAARALHESDIGAIVHIVGFDVDAKAAAQLKSAAKAGGGNYYDAHNAAELGKIMTDIFNEKEWNDYWLCMTNAANEHWLKNTSAINNSWLCYTSKANDEWLKMTSRVNDNYYTVYNGCGSYLHNRISERSDIYHKKAAELKTEQDRINRETEAIEAMLEKEASRLTPTPAP